MTGPHHCPATRSPGFRQLGEVMEGISDAAQIGLAHGLDRAVAAIDEMIVEAEAQADFAERCGLQPVAQRRQDRARALRDARSAIEARREEDR